MNKKNKVIVAMSGGLDSAVSAYLLKKRGCAVTGVYLRLFQNDQKEKQAKRVAEAVGVNLIVRDVSGEFRKKVIDYFLKEYEIGRTPNPCVACNQEIKFKFLFQELLKTKNDYVATGHYAIIRREIDGLQETSNKSKVKNLKYIYKLLEAKDKTKDQSYFLYTLNQKRLAKILFPLGNYKKMQVIEIAKKAGLSLVFFNKESKKYKESQDICFIADKNLDAFLKDNLKNEPGDIVDTKGALLGKHEGLFLYTLGQRRGIKIGGKGPYYVIRKNKNKNILVVSDDRNDPAFFSKKALVKNVSWIFKKPKMPARALVRNRYRDPLIYAIIKSESYGNKERETCCLVKFEKPQRAVSCGQSAVFYSQKGELIGGGVIAKT